MHYMIFVPQAALPENKAGDAKAVLAHVGLADICDGSPVLSPVVDHGPNGGPGVMIGWGGAASPCKLAEQSWTKMPLSGVWLGVWKDKSPKPEDLRRDKTSPGQEVEMADGMRYLIPHARKGPLRMAFDADGNLVQERIGKLAEIYEFCNEVVCPKWFGGAGEVDWTEAAKFASRLLAINYRLTYEIAVCRGLLSDESMLQSCRVAIELDAILDYLGDDGQKKSEGQD